MLTYVKLTFTSGAAAIYMISAAMPVVEFKKAVQARKPDDEIKGIEFLHQPADLPKVAELIPFTV